MLQLTASLKFYYEKIKNKERRKRKKEFCSSSEIFIKVSLRIIMCTKYFVVHAKTITRPSYMLNVRFFNSFSFTQIMNILTVSAQVYKMF